MTEPPGARPEPLLPDPLRVEARQMNLDELLEREWLLTNRLGSYASASVAGCNTRRYHGLLIASTSPPVGRVAMLNTVMETVEIDGQSFQLACNEFAVSVDPTGHRHLVEFVDDIAPTFVYRVGQTTLVKQLILAETENVVAVRYRIESGKASIRLQPFFSIRDFHHLRLADQGHQLSCNREGNWIAVNDAARAIPPLHLQVDRGEFTDQPLWWYQFQYRQDRLRGQDCYEDLWSAGTFQAELTAERPVQLTAALHAPQPLDFDKACQARRRRRQRLADAVADAGQPAMRLALASDAFVVQRHFPDRPASATILAGYHWFADWGRDTFISLPGLLLATGRFDEARQVFRTFSAAVSEGMVPNRFDDYSASAHYNAIDASLWFIVAAERFLQATDDQDFWEQILAPACRTILGAYRDGTRFGIHADGDGLLTGGSYETQLTWMDAALGGEVVTPRQGKAVEINALWYCAHRILADRLAEKDPRAAEQYAQQAEIIAKSFNQTFWNGQMGWLHDCVDQGQPDASLRPNQIFAVCLPYSPLDEDRQRAVVSIVLQKLLTPYGLRTLSPDDQRYRRRYGGSWESRDRAYHQGTVWAWLLGPFIEAYLKLEGQAPLSLGKAKLWLQGLEAHLHDACLGQISEIFDGDPPHSPRGCVAQAWSVAEVLRARMLVQQYQRDMRDGRL